MKRTYLNENWQVVSTKPNYWELLSYILFVAFILTALWGSIQCNDKNQQQLANKWLKAENDSLKKEIVRGNEQVNKEFNPYKKRISVYKSKWEGENEN